MVHEGAGEGRLGAIGRSGGMRGEGGAIEDGDS